MLSVIQIFKALWAMHPSRFWMIWFTATTASLIYVASMVGHQAVPTYQKITRGTINLVSTRPKNWNPRVIGALTLLAIFLASYITIILVWEDFAYYDNDDFMLYTLKGLAFSPPIWPQNGRFFPFGLIEFNLLRHITNTPIGYQVFPIVEVVIFFYILLILDTDLNIRARAGLAILALLTPSVLLSFGGLIFEERNVLLLIAGLALSVKQFERTKAVGWAVAAVVCGQLMLYFKEVAFLLLFGFAAGRLILRCRNGQDARWDYKRLRDQEGRLDLCLAGLAVVFLFSYFAVMGLHGNTSYAARASRPRAEIVLDYLKLDLLVWLFMAVVLRRTYLILRCRRVPWLLWDGLACGGVAWVLGYLTLSMYSGYYLAPADLIAVLYVGRVVLLSWKKTPFWSKTAVLMLGLLVVSQDVSLSMFTVFERKNLIHAKAEIASTVEARNKSGDVPSLFFPFAKPYYVMEFLVYLNYRGVRINSAALLNAGVAKDGPCVDYRPTIRCLAASGPAPGDLVIVLPDDEVSFAEAAPYREGGASAVVL